MTAGLPEIPSGPLDRMPSGFATSSEREQLLRTVLADAGVVLGAYDEVIVRWLVAVPDWSTFAAVVSWIVRAAKHP